MRRRPHVSKWSRAFVRGARDSFFELGSKVAIAVHRRQDIVMWAAVALMFPVSVQQSKVDAGSGLSWWFIVASALFTLTMVTAAFGTDLFGRGGGSAKRATSPAS